MEKESTEVFAKNKVLFETWIWGKKNDVLLY